MPAHIYFFSSLRCHYFLRRDGLGGICITSVDYPRRIAFNIIQDSMAKFELWLHQVKAAGQWPSVVQDDKYSGFKFLQQMVIRSEPIYFLCKLPRYYVSRYPVLMSTISSSCSKSIDLNRAQDPADCDRFCKVHKKIDEVKSVLHKSFQSVLRRGETLDRLINISNDISDEAKMFVNSSKRSKCCLIM